MQRGLASSGSGGGAGCKALVSRWLQAAWGERRSGVRKVSTQGEGQTAGRTRLGLQGWQQGGMQWESVARWR
jgi:hypothetical protein